MSDLVDKVAWAINKAWNERGEIPFPLYQYEAEFLAEAAIKAMKQHESSPLPLKEGS